MIDGIIAWGSVVLINLSLLFVFQLWKKSRKVRILNIVIIILISDILTHVLIAFTSSYSEMMMWIMISFPSVAIVSFCICLIGRIFFELWAKRYPFFKNGIDRNSKME